MMMMMMMMMIPCRFSRAAVSGRSLWSCLSTTYGWRVRCVTPDIRASVAHRLCSSALAPCATAPHVQLQATCTEFAAWVNGPDVLHLHV
jgi:hypothetical protein